jgi:hypothetical protein
MYCCYSPLLNQVFRCQAIKPFSSTQSNHDAHVGSWRKVREFPTTTRPRLARVIATFNLRLSFKKPTTPSEFDLTVDIMINSFSRP